MLSNVADAGSVQTLFTKVCGAIQIGVELPPLELPPAPASRESSWDLVIQVFAPLSSETHNVLVLICFAKISPIPFVASASQVLTFA